MRKHFASAGSVQSGSDNWDPSLKTLCRHFAWHAYETKIWYVKLSRSRWQLEFFAIMKLFVKFLRNESESLWRLFHKNSCSDNSVHVRFTQTARVVRIAKTRGRTCDSHFRSSMGTQRPGGKGRYPAKLHLNPKLTWNHAFRCHPPDCETSDKQKRSSGSNLVVISFYLPKNFLLSNPSVTNVLNF